MVELSGIRVASNVFGECLVITVIISLSMLEASQGTTNHPTAVYAP